ncbi:uncharacterized protein FSUBG_10634 [Fusarium subglutinans]|uniref:HNH nuclease domain-containing protein n=1 Tax=Gibberella subglutinans TaxID=42677 RepID=A0A8H5P6L5_GIBSU|nr:uncharacterized protein FSUBG_10634 [Fusarium subglutinans]KAF5590905.1 hypothetical protein FSUBG_10634 [Fusarium subglutinans]
MSQQELTGAFFNFLSQNSGHPTRLSALKSFLVARPEVKPVADLLPVDEMNARLDLIEVVQTNIAVLRPDRPLNHIQFCYLVGMPLGDLQAFAHLNALHVFDAVRGLGKLTAHFFKRDKYSDPSPPPTPSPAPKDSGSRRGGQESPRYHPALPPGPQGSSHRRTVSEGRITKPRSDSSPNLPPKSSRRPHTPTAPGGSPQTPRTGGSTFDSAPSSTRSQRTQVPRTRRTIDECKRLDQYRCIVTGLADPEGCHIVPFHWNQDQEHLEKTTELLKTVQTITFEQRTTNASKTLMEITKGVKSSDMPWNLLCLSPQLHTWWGKAYFGFKYYDTVLCEDDPNYSIISLQFVWMPSNVKAMATDQIDLGAQRDPLTALGIHLTHRYGDGPLSACTTRNCTKCRETLGVQCHDISSNRPVESGTIVKVKRLTKDRHLLEHVIKLQWSITCAAAMSGGAQIYEDDLLSESEDSPCESVSEQQDLEESGEELKEDGENTRQASIEKVDSWLQQSDPVDDMGPS